jgi:hypothetical protein
MLYRNPDVSVRLSPFARVLRAAASLGAARRRRQAELDVLAMNPHIRRDLGLETFSILGR